MFFKSFDYCSSSNAARPIGSMVLSPIVLQCCNTIFHARQSSCGAATRFFAPANRCAALQHDFSRPPIVMRRCNTIFCARQSCCSAATRFFAPANRRAVTLHPVHSARLLTKVGVIAQPPLTSNCTGRFFVCVHLWQTIRGRSAIQHTFARIRFSAAFSPGGAQPRPRHHCCPATDVALFECDKIVTFVQPVRPYLLPPKNQMARGWPASPVGMRV
jgi:hypothetical protein